ncbi:hypothetical protein QQF64_003698 [Cirrhinus molitorella]|uniref:Opioid growth factor receptor (OGFr) conserved domain-containing protein n=1 Tax=Cirrhinus molitorella TaxID=172907 RepID=A0ABR3MM21_9TELE
MLDFYGIRLVDELTGEVACASNWEDRFRNLNRYSNNNLRITRILKCLGTLGLKHYQTPLVKFFLQETLVKGQLQNVKQSVLDYFLFAVLEKSDRRELVRFAFNHFKPQEHFVWGPKKILLGQVACCKNEKVDQPTDYKQSRKVKDQQKRVKPQGSKHEMNMSYPLKKMESKKDHQNKDEAVTANKLKETKSDQGANKSIIIPNKLRDVVNSSYQTEEKTSCQVSDIEIKDKTEHEESEDKQKWVNLNELKHEIKKIDANYLPEEMESKTDHQNLDEPVTVNKLKETKSVQEANKSSQCRSENESVAKINNEMTVGVGDDDVSGPYQTIEMSSCEMSDMTVGDDNEDCHESSLNIRDMESDEECEFDSTWEDEYENKTPRKKVMHRKSCRNTYAAKDMQDFRYSCQNFDDDDDNDEKGRFHNLEFYYGKIKSSPEDVHIDEFHQQWWGEYESLEIVLTCIHWLFPLQDQGVNWSAHCLTIKEIQLFRKDEQAKSKLVKSYKLMLDFYGIRLVNESTGEVERAPNWRDRFRNLNRYSHNNLRITRILKCLGTLGLEHYQAPLVKFFLHETLVVGHLQSLKQSVLDYFMFAVLDKSERRELVRFAFKHFKPQEQFVWGPKKILSEQRKDRYCMVSI